MDKKVKLIIEIVIFIVALCALTGVYYFSKSSSKEQEEAANVGIIKINDSNFSEEVLNSEKPVIVEFTSKSCPPCVAMLTTLINIAKNNGDVVIGTVDMDGKESEEIIKRYGIQATPTIIIFEAGSVKETILGAASEDKIMTALRK